MNLHLKYDVAIIGGGVVGLATAWQLANQHPDIRIALLEKENSFAEHQSGRNSGVLHTGIYYKPGSMKAINCKIGKLRMQEFCQEYNIAYEICGKVIVALDESELPLLQRIYERGVANQVNCKLISRAELADLEPHAAGIQAIHVPEAGIVNYQAVCERLAQLLRDRGHAIQSNAKVLGVVQRSNAVSVDSTWQSLDVRVAINCAGLHCDRVIRLSGDKPQAKIIPFRGEYFKLKPEVNHLCKNLIYPVADPKFPFLGVHFTRMIGGGVECGPNAVLAFSREGYTKTQVNLRDLFETLTYRGFIRMAAKHWRMGVGELWRSTNKAAFVRALQRLMPAIRFEHLVPAPAGVRAQAVLPDGNLVDDFLITGSANMIHVNNAPSPAATAAFNIGQLISERIKL